MRESVSLPAHDRLPFDVYLYILEQYSPIVSVSPSEVEKTFVACLQTGSSNLREAALMPRLWKPHYQARYTVFDVDNETSRKGADNNWQVMYRQRRLLDRRAQSLLNDVVVGLEREARVNEIIQTLSFDVWNIIVLEIQRVNPEILQQAKRDRMRMLFLSRTYWAKQILDAISRRAALKMWSELPTLNREPCLESHFAALSGFFSVPPTEISTTFTLLTSECRSYIPDLAKLREPATFPRNITLITAICKRICSFMSSRGFQVATGEFILKQSPPDLIYLREGAAYYSIWNHLPHTFLTTHRATLPVPLLYVFVCIARRLGIPALPVANDSKFFVHVPVNDDSAAGVYVDVCAGEVIDQLPDPPPFPKNVKSLLTHTSINIMSALALANGGMSAAESNSAKYVAYSLGSIIRKDHRSIDFLVDHIALFPLDARAVLQDTVAPLVSDPAHQWAILERCRACAVRDQREAD
ncbi:hypothetical protein BV22DRAFT_1135734, partial [Leucogyrophana mollusca]